MIPYMVIIIPYNDVVIKSFSKMDPVGSCWVVTPNTSRPAVLVCRRLGFLISDDRMGIGKI
jgi:succinylarginine dihydrolase